MSNDKCVCGHVYTRHGANQAHGGPGGACDNERCNCVEFCEKVVPVSATPRPWVMRGHGAEIWSGGDRSASRPIVELIGTKSMLHAERGIANIALIVEAVNSFDVLKAQNAELMEALTDLVELVAAKIADDRPEKLFKGEWEFARLDRARAALAKAGGK